MNTEHHHLLSPNAPDTSYCRTHELHLMQFSALYAVSQILSRSLEYRETLREVLRILNDEASLIHGMVSVVDPAAGHLSVNALHGIDPGTAESISYKPGEGILGHMLERPRSVVLRRVADDPRFLNKLGIYDPELPFIAVPIKVGGVVRGALAAQPDQPGDELLEDRAQFLEMVANLIGQTVKLATEIEEEKANLLEERDLLRRTVRHQHGFDSVVGRSTAMRRVFEQARLVARWNTTVLIRGETGTGKELIANAIHYNSPRTRNAFVKLNCAALPENLLETELFGHERGAFTGAVDSRKGRFEQAHGGTIFLDEIGEISPAFQAKLLRVLQEGEFERVGGGKTIKVDVRIIAATHRDLEAAVHSGAFREDLFYRLNVMPLFLPPLRERIEDIPDIARHLLGKIGNTQKRKLSVTDAAIRRLANHQWPGNVRELENCLERAAVLSEDGRIDVDLIRFQNMRERQGFAPPRAGNAPEMHQTGGDIAGGAPAGSGFAAPTGGFGGAANAVHAADSADDGATLGLSDRDQRERSKVIGALEQAGWVQAKAARILGMTPRQIAYRIQILKIDVKQF